MSEYIEVGQPLQFTDPNTPTRAGEIVEIASDIYNIPSPRLGMQVFVKSEKKSFVITSLKSKTIGGVNVPEAAVEAFEPVGAKEITWNNDTDQSNMNDFVVAGVYDIKGEHKRVDDNLPVLNTGGGHSFNARLTVLDSSISGSGKDDDKCITQVLSFSNRLGQGEVYIRTGKGSSLDNLTFEKWSTLQRNVNVGEVGSLDDLKDNGIYSGVWLFGSLNNYPLTFVCVVINDYFIGTAPRRVSQFVYGLSKFDSSVVYQSRVWDDSKDKWSDWEILNQKEISSMINSSVDNAIKGVIADAPEAFDTLKEIADWIADDETGAVALANAISANTKAVNTEVTRAKQAEKIIDGKLDDEIDRSATADLDLLKSIDEEARRATEAEQAIIEDTNEKIAIEVAAVGKAVADEAARAQAAEKVLEKKLDSLSPGGGGGVAELMEEVTYSELVALRDNSNLLAGMKYRITDYVTTTVEDNTKSANHPFDIIVEAVSENALSELAQAIQHEGDTYFDGNDLGAWQLWYDLDNNTDKYNWADAKNGKGVIYRMIDEKKNDCPYDFKNMLFRHTAFTIGTTSDRYHYTFSYVVSNVLYDGTIEKRVTNCHDNSIGVYTASNGKSCLNGNIFRNTSFGNNCHSNTFSFGCYDNTFGKECYGNTFGYNCYSNKFGNSCYYNIFGRNCYNNNFGNRCLDNTLSAGCVYMKFKDDTQDGNFSDNNTSITYNEEYYDDGTNALVPIKHPDLSTQPSILPYKFMGQYVYEQLLVTNNGGNYYHFDIPSILAVYNPLIISIDVIGTVFTNALKWNIEGNRLFVDIGGSDMVETTRFLKIVYTSMPEEDSGYYGYNNY